MRQTPGTINTRSSILLLLGVAGGGSLPGGAGAQTAAPRYEPGTLGAAVSEARRSPFHGRSALDGLATPAPSRSRPAHPPLHAVAAPGDVTFPRVFWPSLVAAVLSDFVFMHSLTCLFGDGYCEVPDDLQYGYFGLGVALAGTGPPLGARLGGGSFSKALIGSVLGFGAGLGLNLLVDHVTAVLAVPVIHAAATAGLGAL